MESWAHSPGRRDVVKITRRTSRLRLRMTIYPFTSDLILRFTKHLAFVPGFLVVSFFVPFSFIAEKREIGQTCYI